MREGGVAGSEEGLQRDSSAPAQLAYVFVDDVSPTPSRPLRPHPARATRGLGPAAPRCLPRDAGTHVSRYFVGSTRFSSLRSFNACVARATIIPAPKQCVASTTKFARTRQYVSVWNGHRRQYRCLHLRGVRLRNQLRDRRQYFGRGRGGAGHGCANEIGVCVLPFVLITIAMAATTLGLGLEGVGGTQAAGIMIIGGAVTLSAACVCCGLTTCKLVFFEGAAWCHAGDGIGDPDTCSGLKDCCSGFCSLIAGLLCYPRTLWRRRQEVRRRRELEALGEGTAGPAAARAADPTCIAVELEPQPPGEVTTKEPDPAPVPALAPVPAPAPSLAPASAPQQMKIRTLNSELSDPRRTRSSETLV